MMDKQPLVTILRTLITMDKKRKNIIIVVLYTQTWRQVKKHILQLGDPGTLQGQ